ncbi:MAG: methionyl-tRNA formyltransferase [Patescibacteria group bacterium]
MKIVFFGTSDRSIPILESLKSHFDIVLCITKKDVVVGRKQVKKETGVKKWAKENNINFLEISSLKNRDLESVVYEIKRVNPDYGVVADFSFIIPKEIINLFDIRLINIHFSLLPKYRGSSPVQFAILNGDETTGVTFHMVDEKMDNGPILFQSGYKTNGTETSGDLYDILFKVASDKLPEVLEKYSSGQIKPIPQDKELATFTYSKTYPKSTFIFKEDTLINWNSKPEGIDRMIRAFNPWPVAWSYLKDLEKSKNLTKRIKLKNNVNKKLKIKIYKALIKEGKLLIEQVQVEGKNKMSWKDFENGYLDSTN